MTSRCWLRGVGSVLVVVLAGCAGQPNGPALQEDSPGVWEALSAGVAHVDEELAEARALIAQATGEEPLDGSMFDWGVLPEAPWDVVMLSAQNTVLMGVQDDADCMSLGRDWAVLLMDETRTVVGESVMVKVAGQERQELEELPDVRACRNADQRGRLPIEAANVEWLVATPGEAQRVADAVSVSGVGGNGVTKMLDEVNAQPALRLYEVARDELEGVIHDAEDLGDDVCHLGWRYVAAPCELLNRDSVSAFKGALRDAQWLWSRYSSLRQDEQSTASSVYGIVVEIEQGVEAMVSAHADVVAAHEEWVAAQGG